MGGTGLRRSDTANPVLWVVAVVSVLAHSLFLFVVIPALNPPPDPMLHGLECPMQCPDDNEIFQVRIIPVESAPFPPARFPIAPLAELPELPQPVPQEPEPEEEEQPPEPEEIPPDAYMVEMAPEEEPVEAPEEPTPYLAAENHRAEIEHQAAITEESDPGRERQSADTNEDAPGEPNPEVETEVAERAPEDEAPSETDAEVGEDEQAMDDEPAHPESGEQLARGHTPVGPDGQLPSSDPNFPPHDGPGNLDLGAFNPTAIAYAETLGQEDRSDRERIERHMRYDGYLGGDDDAEWERTRAAIENMIPEARFGTETELNARASQYAQYLTHVHRRIHNLWADGFLMSLDLDPLGDLNNPNLEAVVELVISSSGEVVRANLVDSSGETMFDSEAIGIAYDISPLEPPPSAIVSENGNAYIHWTFWRDNRQCGTFGASVHRVGGS